jgi:hypothetical protein
MTFDAERGRFKHHMETNMTVPAAGTKAGASSANGSSNDRAAQAAEFGAAAGGQTETSSASGLPAAGAAAPAARVAQAES